jgi:hypothetical protein
MCLILSIAVYVQIHACTNMCKGHRQHYISILSILGATRSTDNFIHVCWLLQIIINFKPRKVNVLPYDFPNIKIVFSKLYLRWNQSVSIVTSPLTGIYASGASTRQNLFRLSMTSMGDRLKETWVLVYQSQYMECDNLPCQYIILSFIKLPCR